MSKSKDRARRRFLDPAKIDAAIAEIAAVAKAQHVRVALAGGCALQLYGSDRFTADVDVIASKDLEISSSRGSLSFGGIKAIAANGVPVDIILRNDDYAGLYEEALLSARKVPGIPLAVVTLPYLCAMKMIAGRGKDDQDLAWILTQSGVSYQSLRAIVKEHLGLYAASDLDSTRSAAVWERKNRT